MEWIDCNKKEPPEETDVLCYRGARLPPVVAGLFNGVMMSEDSGREVRGDITHWMPLPAGPNAQGEPRS